MSPWTRRTGQFKSCTSLSLLTFIIAIHRHRHYLAILFSIFSSRFVIGRTKRFSCYQCWTANAAYLQHSWRPAGDCPSLAPPTQATHPTVYRWHVGVVPTVVQRPLRVGVHTSQSTQTGADPDPGWGGPQHQNPFQHPGSLFFFSSESWNFQSLFFSSFLLSFFFRFLILVISNIILNSNMYKYFIVLKFTLYTRQL